MEKLLIILCLSVPVNGNSQLATKVIDQFTGDIKHESNWGIFNESAMSAPNWYLTYIRFHHIEPNYLIELRSTTNHENLTIKDGSSIEFKFVNDQILTGISQGDSHARIGDATIVGNDSFVLGIRIMIIVDREVIEKLSVERISYIHISPKFSIPSTKKKYQEEVMRLAKHLLWVVDHDP